MPRDYAPRKATQSKKRSGNRQADTPRFSGRSFGGGMFCGAAVVLGLIYGPSLRPASFGAATTEPPSATTTPSPPSFEFLELLPAAEVVTNVTPYEPPLPEASVEQTSDAQSAPARTVADASAASKPAAAKAETAERAESKSPTIYLLQAASFRNKDDADAMRAALLLEGLNASLDEVRRADGALHRVMVGPFASERAMERTLTQLRAKDIPAMRAQLPSG